MTSPATPPARSTPSRRRSWSALCSGWGLNQVAVKLALPEIPPLIQATVRSIGALSSSRSGRGCAASSFTARRHAGRRRSSPACCSAFEFLLIFPGLRLTDREPRDVCSSTPRRSSSRSARAGSCSASSCAPSQWVGLVLSFAGLVVAFGVPMPAARSAPAARRHHDGRRRRRLGARPRWSSRRTSLRTVPRREGARSISSRSRSRCWRSACCRWASA